MAVPMITLEAEYDLHGNEVRFWKACTALDVWNPLKFFESWQYSKFKYQLVQDFTRLGSFTKPE